MRPLLCGDTGSLCGYQSQCVTYHLLCLTGIDILACLQLLCVIPVPLVRWILCGVAFLLSGFFLVANVYPILASVSSCISQLLPAADEYIIVCQADRKAVRLIIVLLVLIHAGIALCFKVLFFSYYVKQIGMKDPIDPPIPAQPTITTTPTS